MYTAELLSELVKATSDEHPKRKKKDTNLYGTVVLYDNKTYVKIDGSDMLTPVFTTSEMNAGDRVVLKITDHNATVTGNITNPSTSGKGIDDRILQVESNFEQKLDGFKMEVTGSFVTNDNLKATKQELTELADSKIAEADKALRSDFTNLENRIEKSQTTFEQDFNSFKTTVAGTYLTKKEFEDSDVGNLASSVTRLEQDLTGFKTTVSGTYVTNDTYNSDNKTFRDQITGINDNITAFDQSITDLYGKSDDLTTDINGVNTKIGNMQTTISGHTTSIGSLQQTVTRFEQDLTGFKTTVAGTYLTKKEFEDSDIGSLSASMSRLEQDLTGFKTTVAGTYVTNDTHQADITNLNTDIADLNTNFTNAKKDIATNKTNIGTLQTSFTTLEQDLTGFRSTVASTYVTQENYNNTNDTFASAINSNSSGIASITSRVSQVEQTADKISFIVASGDSSSSMVLTDDFYSLVSNNIKLTADKITVEGLTSINENFKILLDGTCEVTDLVVTNSISVGNIIAEGANIPWITQSITRDMQIYIDANHVYDDDEYTIETEDTFASFADFISVCPRNLNGYQITIDMVTNITENASLYSLNNGTILINMKGHSLKGYIYGNKRTCRYLIYGNDSENVGGSVRGKIIPGAVGYLYSGYRYAVMCQRGWLGLYDVDLYAGTDSANPSKCVMLIFGADGYLSNIRAVNDPNSLVRLQASSHVYISSSSGNTTSTTFQSVSGSIMQINPGTHAGRSGGTAQKYTANNGLIFDEGVTYKGSSISDSGNTNDNTDTTENRASVINSDYGDSYRTTKYNNWKKDNTVRQGQYGYGMNKGCWFFGNDLYEVLRNAKSIESIKIIIRRQAGGVYAAVTHRLRAHTYRMRPSGEPSYLSTSVFSKTFSLATGSSTTITLTSSEISALKSNGARGFGLYTTSTSTSDYSVCSGKCTIKIKYKE
jgi:peptidoglycan hydrolase CwlO-like protein